MTRVGIKELKARLSEYLVRVRAGELVVVTLRGHDIAQITPVEVSPSMAALGELAQDQRVDWRPRKWDFAAPSHKVRGKPIAQTILEDRGDPLP